MVDLYIVSASDKVSTFLNLGLMSYASVGGMVDFRFHINMGALVYVDPLVLH